mmetsp:Transcript_13825/g.22231  ORF Transcript_13825/g.22231 Transcript_13825/m.22231 type:complete len:128 (+) Transcript_13825:369-752(+)
MKNAGRARARTPDEINRLTAVYDKRMNELIDAPSLPDYRLTAYPPITSHAILFSAFILHLSPLFYASASKETHEREAVGKFYGRRGKPAVVRRTRSFIFIGHIASIDCSAENRAPHAPYHSRSPAFR